MAKDADKYTYRVVWSHEDGEHVGLVAEFPSLSWLAKSAPDALSGIMRLVASTLREMAKAKEKLPEPLSLQKFSGKFMVRIPPAQHRKLALDAAEQGVSMNRLVSQKLSA